MASPGNDRRTVSCVCGGVAFEALGTPMTSVVCYCDDCQEGSRRIAALADAPPVMDADGGTAYVLYRKDRVACTKGHSLLESLKIKTKTDTNRVVATCCNLAMAMQFDDAKHWVPMYRARFRGDVPPLEMRICTRFRPAGVEVPGDVPASSTFPPRFLAKLLGARIAMLLRR